jgi:uncharacterized repeat protein (TIGR01451 family)
MQCFMTSRVIRGMRLALAMMWGLLLVLAMIVFARSASQNVRAAPIDPPEGYPKLSTSTKQVTPTIVHTGGAVLTYRIDVRNTGAYTAENVIVTDVIPDNTVYNNDAQSSSSTAPTFADGILSWVGTVGFDSNVLISYSVTVSPTFEGIVQNEAVIWQDQIHQPVTLTAQSRVTDHPILDVQKSSTPSTPGADKPIIYFLTVTNQGQDAVDLPVTVTDEVPLNTTFIEAGANGQANLDNSLVTWDRTLSLDTGQSSVFTFSVRVDDVPSGTVIINSNYQVSSPDSGVSVGDVYTTTVLDPILYLAKSVDPYPPGSNHEMTYTLTVLNKGSLATDLEITDHLPVGVTYVSGGSYSNGMVTWIVPSLDTNDSVQVSFKAYVGDVAEVMIFNEDYSVCSAEGVCVMGVPLATLVQGPKFEVTATVDPIAKKPGGGPNDEETIVTPTLAIHNLGPGNALDATALLYFRRISVSGSDLVAVPSEGVLEGLFYDGPDCGEKCKAYYWMGDLPVGKTITLTTYYGQSTIGGDEGTHYTATAVVTDTLGDFTTLPVTGTATGTVTHYANLIPTKSAPPVINAGGVMTYSLKVFNSGLSTDTPPYPWLTDTVPSSTTLTSVSDGGDSFVDGDRTVISWTLPDMSPGDEVYRSFSVMVDPDLVSGTRIVNADYRASWHDIEITGVLSNTGVPITTVVKEVGLIDSFKTVTPTVLSPGSGNVLTYTVNVVNSGPSYLHDVTVYDLLPWQESTYLRDATASTGQVMSDIVSVGWVGDVAPFSTEAISFTVMVDEAFQGPITNTAFITHTSLQEDVFVQAVAYVTDEPVLSIMKSATPDPVKTGAELFYTIKVTNLGQQATNLVVTDTVPANTQYIEGGASDGGQLIGDLVKWQFLELAPGETHSLRFRVNVLGGSMLVNDRYGVLCEEGVSALGEPLFTRVAGWRIYLPVLNR